MLLHDVGQFMSKKMRARGGAGCELSRSKHHMASDGIRLRIHRLCGPGCRRIGMHPYLTEVVPEARLEKGACGRIERLAGH